MCRLITILKDLEEISLKLHELTLVLGDGLEHLHSSLQMINKALDEKQMKTWEDK